MVSLIDPTKPADGFPALKSNARDNWLNAKTEIEALQTATAAINTSLLSTQTLLATDYGVVGDGTTNSSPGLTLALADGITQGKTVIMPPGEVVLNDPIFVDMVDGQTSRLFSFGGTRIIMDTSLFSSLSLRGTERATTNLSADVAEGGYIITVDSVADISIGDLINIKTTTPVESGWNYDKQCIRKVAHINGNDIFLDQMLDFFFTTAEGTQVTSYYSSYAEIHNIDFYAPQQRRTLAFRFLSGLRMFNCTIEGPSEGWQEDFSDGTVFTYCTNVLLDGVNYHNCRYGPFIVGGRFFRVQNSWARGVRHLDVNSWGHDITFDNITAFATDGIIQSHPSIRVHFRNIVDSVTEDGLSGLGIRGLGETVENCQINSLNGVSEQTQRAILYDDYKPMSQKYTRTYRNLWSPTSVLSAGWNGSMIVEQCRVPRIAAIGGSHGLGSITVDDETKMTMSYRDLNKGVQQINHKQLGGPRNIAADDDYAAIAAPTAITAMSLAGPLTITSPSNGLIAGDTFRVTNPTGADELNYNFYKVASVAGDVITVNDLDDNPVDASAFTAYTSDGFVTKHEAGKSFRRYDHYNVGRFPHSNLRLTRLGDGSVSQRIILYSETGAVDQRDRWGFLTIRSRADTGFSEQVFYYTHDVNPGLLIAPTVVANRTEIFGETATISDVRAHFVDSVNAEGGNGLAQTEDLYWSFDLAMSGTCRQIEVELKEWIRGDVYENQTLDF